MEIIKPSSKTPHGLHNHQLSMLDYAMSQVYTSSCLFYTNKDSPIPQKETTEKLKTSLSETLSKFYPFAGRMNEVTVDCNDEGAIFLEARLDNTTLSDFLNPPDHKEVEKLLPLDAVENPKEAAVTWPMLLVKATYFQCGGLAIGICISHRLADAASLSTFIRFWSAAARGESNDAVGKPEFAEGKKLYPPANEAFKAPVDYQNDKKSNITKRFVFSGSMLEELRIKSSTQDHVPRPTRVESVTALIWRCVANPKVSSSACTKVLGQPANLRPKLPSLLSQNLIGNVYYNNMTFNREGEIDIQEAVKELRGRAEELKLLFKDHDDASSLAMVSSKFQEVMLDSYRKLMNEGPHELCVVSSWCKLQLYEANFGTGSPVWVVGNVAPNVDFMTTLLDSNDFEGIEAWVTLGEEDMSSFEQTTELVYFSSPNPTVNF